MRLLEIISAGWLLSFKEKQAVGSVVERQGSTYPLGSFLEGHLERRRPKRQLSRADTFYFSDHAAGTEGYAYIVEPAGQLDRQHTGWLQLLLGANQACLGELDHYAQGYWSGTEVPELRTMPWEYRAAKVKVLKLIASP